MEDRRTEIFNALDGITGIEVFEEFPEEVTTPLTEPIVLYSLEANVPQYTLDKQIAKQDVTVKVDIYANDSIEVESVLEDVEAAMRNIEYLLSFNADLPDPNGYFHITTQFIY